MVIATFGPTTGWVGKTIAFENGQFVLEGHGPIPAQAVLEYDEQGHLLWADEQSKEWVKALLPSGPPAAIPASTRTQPATGSPRAQPVGVAQPLSATVGGTGLKRSHKVRNVVLVVVGVLALLLVIGIATSGPSAKNGGQSQIASGGSGGDASDGDAAEERPNVGAVGEQCMYTDTDGSRAIIALVSVDDASQPKNASIGEPPEFGEFAVCDISIRCTDGTYDFNPLYFNYQAPDGRTYDAMEGNAIWAGFEPALDSGTLSTGQSTRGYVTFDVPAGSEGAKIQLTDPLGSVVFEWKR